MSEILLNVRIDNVKFKNKPTKDQFKGITYRLQQSENVTITIPSLANHFKQGKNTIPAHFKSTGGYSKTNTCNINLLIFDIDNYYLDENKEKKFTNHSSKDVIGAFRCLLHAEPAIIYRTYTGVNNKNNSPRFRLVYTFEVPLQFEEYELLMDYLINYADLPKGMIDEVCKNPNRPYNGTNKDVYLVPNHKHIKKEKIQLFIDTVKETREEEEEKKEQAKKLAQLKAVKINKNNINDNYDIDVTRDIDIVDLYNRIASDPRIGCKGSDYIQYKTCPICGGHDDFSIRLKDNSFTCFKTNMRGNVINLYSIVMGVDTGQAYKELIDMYNLKSISPIEATNILNIDKHIAIDLKASSYILETIKAKDKILLNAPMGTGKTYLTIKNLYPYAQSLNKKMIIVIPNKAQQDNLKENENYKVPIVNQNHQYNFKDDIITVTPESLPKVTEKLKKDDYFLVVDEAHETVTSFNFRRGYKDRNIVDSEKKAFKTIHITATPRTLLFDNYEEIIKINPKVKIENKINIMPIPDGKPTTINRVIETEIKTGKQALLFNNDIKTNKNMTNVLNGTILNDPTVKVKGDEVLTPWGMATIESEIVKEKNLKEAETLSSKDKETLIKDAIKKGTIPKELKMLAFTSTINAGIDLKTKHNNPILIINAYNNTNIDSLIQLIGRFREGIEVLILVKQVDENKEVESFSFENKYKICSHFAMGSLEFVRNNPSTYAEIKRGYIKNSHIEKDETGDFYINNNSLVSQVYEAWNNELNNDYRLLIEELNKQDAFTVKSINVVKFDDTEPENEILKKFLEKCRREKKDLKAQSIKLLSDATNEDISKIFNCPIEEESEEVLKLKKAYKTLKELDSKFFKYVNEVVEVLEVDRIDAIQRVVSEKPKDLKLLIEQVNTIRVNKLIKQNGADTYLNSKYTKRGVEAQQALIIKELEPVAKKYGRITDHILRELTTKILKGGFVSKKRQEKCFQGKEAEKHFYKEMEQVFNKIKLMYTLREAKKGNPLLSSLKIKMPNINPIKEVEKFKNITNNQSSFI